MDNPFPASPASGKIILKGLSCSAKTTLALASQIEIDMPFIRFSFDLFLDYKSFPMEQIESGGEGRKRPSALDKMLQEMNVQ